MSVSVASSLALAALQRRSVCVLCAVCWVLGVDGGVSTSARYRFGTSFGFGTDAAVGESG
jgi:hypothetical protein